MRFPKIMNPNVNEFKLKFSIERRLLKVTKTMIQKEISMTQTANVETVTTKSGLTYT